MESNLAGYIKTARIEQKISYSQLALKMGYKNITKGMNKIISLEREGIVYPEILKKLIRALKLNQERVNKLIIKDRLEYEKEFEQWVNEPVKISYTIRAMPAVYLSYDLPDKITSEEQAIQFVVEIAKKKRLKAWLNLSRKEKVYITEKGGVTGKIKTTIDNTGYPYMRIMQVNFLLLCFSGRTPDRQKSTSNIYSVRGYFKAMKNIWAIMIA